MHKVRRAAHKGAWYTTDNDGVKTFNPFGRYNNHHARTRSDVETGLRPTQTENDAPSPAEDRRREQFASETAPYSGPQKSSTFSDVPQSGLQNGLQPSERSDFSSAEKTNSEDTTNAGLPAAETVPSDSTTGAVEANGPSQGPRRRKILGIPLGKQKDPNHVQTEEEKEKYKRMHPNISIMSQVKTVFGSWINILLLAVPVGIALGNVFKGDNQTQQIIVFVVNFIAIIPLAAMLSFATEELALYVGETLGGLLNASFGNAVELIVGIIALVDNEILIVQTSLIGSMLSNLLLVMGMCFFCGGINRTEQHFNHMVAQTAASLLALAIGSLIIPTAFAIFDSDPNDVGVTPLSRGTAVLLLVVYGCYLIFQLRTHVTIYNMPSEKSPKKDNGKKDQGEAFKGIAMIGAASGAATAGGNINSENLVQDPEDDDEPETPSLTRLGALITLAGSTVFVALCAEYMVNAINAVATAGLPREFIGLILLPIVGNAAEHATAVTVAIKDKMDLAIGVAIGSSLQIALLVLPVMVMLNWWGVGSDVLNFHFDGFLVVVLVIAIWLVNYLIADGKSHWLEGVLLMITYLIIATAAWFYPGGVGT